MFTLVNVYFYMCMCVCVCVETVETWLRARERANQRAHCVSGSTLDLSDVIPGSSRNSPAPNRREDQHLPNTWTEQTGGTAGETPEKKFEENRRVSSRAELYRNPPPLPPPSVPPSLPLGSAAAAAQRHGADNKCSPAAVDPGGLSWKLLRFWCGSDPRVNGT